MRPVADFTDSCTVSVGDTALVVHCGHGQDVTSWVFGQGSFGSIVSYLVDINRSVR